MHDYSWTVGIDAETGWPASSPVPGRVLAELARGEPFDLPAIRLLQAVATRELGGGELEGRSGGSWGLIAPHDLEPAVLTALGPLRAWRRERSAAYREWTGAEGLRPCETLDQLLQRVGGHAALPSALLLVGGPDRISYKLQVQLQPAVAVGRLALDSVQAYARYAQAVLEIESGPAAEPGRSLMFVPTYRDDEPSRWLATEWAAAIRNRDKDREAPGRIVERVGPEATKPRLMEWLRRGGDERGMALLLAAGQTIADDPIRSGGLIAAEWDNLAARGRPLRDEETFTAADLDTLPMPNGLVAWLIGSGTAGSASLRDQGAAGLLGNGDRSRAPTIAPLAERWLNHEAGPALAVVGTVDRLWGPWPAPLLGRSARAVAAWLAGRGLGEALGELWRSGASDTLRLFELTRAERQGQVVAPEELARAWLAHRAGRGLILLGDPAIRRPISRAVAPTHRPPRSSG